MSGHDGGTAMLPYLKLFSEARNDAKLRSLTSDQFRVWFNLLCFASEQPERGTIRGLTHHHVAVEVAGGNQDLLVETCNALGALQSVTWRYTDDGCVEIVFTRFEKRQKRKPSDSAQRVKERVTKHRGAKSSGSNAFVTPCNAPVTRRNALEVEVEEEENTPPKPPHGGVEGRRSRSTGDRTRETAAQRKRREMKEALLRKHEEAQRNANGKEAEHGDR